MNKLSPDQIALLKRPLPSEAIKPHPTKTYLSSIKAIYVVERLNEVFGLGGWFATNEVVKEEGKWVVIKTTFNAPEYGIVIPDIFGGNDNADLGDAYKGACTDALTKIGSYLYIGMDVYKGKKAGEVEVDEIGDDGRDELLRLLENSTYETKVATALKASIAFKKTRQEFEDAKKKLLANQMDINGVQNPSAKDINAHVRKISKQPA
jgi:hypothetical protein